MQTKTTQMTETEQRIVENRRVGQKVFAAFAKGDLAAFTDQFWTPDVVMHFAGKTPFSGTHRGKQAALAAVRRSFELSMGTLNVENVEVLAGERHVTFYNRVRASRNGKVLDTHESVTVRLEEGKTAEWILVPHDLHAWETFWS